MLRRFALFFVLVSALIVFVSCSIPEETSSKFEAAVDVGIDKAVNELSRKLGDLDVKRREIVNAIDASKEELARLEEAKIRNTVEAELANNEAVALEEELASLQRQMLKLAEYLENGEELQLQDGSTMSAEEMNQLADDLIFDYNILDEKLTLKQQAIETYQSNSTYIETRLSEGRRVVARMEGQLELIDAQIEALKVYEDQPELLAEGGTFNEVIPAAQELINETTAALAEEKAYREASTEQGNRMSQAQEILDSEAPIPTSKIDQLRQLAGESAPEDDSATVEPTEQD